MIMALLTISLLVAFLILSMWGRYVRVEPEENPRRAYFYPFDRYQFWLPRTNGALKNDTGSYREGLYGDVGCAVLFFVALGVGIFLAGVLPFR